MTSDQLTADVFWTAFQAMSRKEQQAFLLKLSSDQHAIEILEDLCYGVIADQRKGEPRKSLDAVVLPSSTAPR